jgi:nucleoside-diphosphate-sugar epimerase
VSLPRLLVTGASGFVGRHLLAAFQDEACIFALARRSQAQSGAPVHPNITWLQADIGDYGALESVFQAVRERGGAEVLIHLAAHYDFTGEDYAEYWRTNVHGMRNVLQLSRDLGLKRFLFPSSVAACRFPAPGEALTEDSPPDGEHVYARTKRAGEEMLAEFRGAVPSNTIRFAALFSDWCEYPPLFMFLRTWLSPAWNRAVLAGRGLSAIPFLHIQDGVLFVRTLLEALPRVCPGEVFVASPDGVVSHGDLFEAATLLFFQERRKPVLVPRLVCAAGVRARDLVGRLLGRRPFERPWMTRYIDLQMRVDGRRTRARLGWSARPRLEILRRLPFLIENLRTAPLEWNRRNRAALEKVRLRTHLVVYALLRRHARDIAGEFAATLLGPEGRQRFPAYQVGLTGDERSGDPHQLLFRHLMDAVRTGERTLLVSYCRDLAERRFELGFSAQEVCDALEELNRVCLRRLLGEEEGRRLRSEIRDHVTMTLRWGCDEVQEVFEHLGTTPSPASAAV